LMVVVDNEFPKRFRELVLFYMVCMITLTIIVNGMTIKWLMDVVDFMPRNPIRENVKKNIKMCLVNAASYHEEAIKNNKFLKHAEWDKVNEQAGIVDSIKGILAEGPTETGERKVELSNFNATGDHLQEPLQSGDQTQSDVLAEVRMRFYTLLKAQIWERFEESICGGDIVNNLSELIDACMEELNKRFWIWECVADQLMTPENITSLLKWKDTPVVGRTIQGTITTKLLQDYEMLTA